jgi:hypothetical protein
MMVIGDLQVEPSRDMLLRWSDDLIEGLGGRTAETMMRVHGLREYADYRKVVADRRARPAVT